MVVKPMVEYLLSNGISLVIASPLKDKADEMISGNQLGTAVEWTMEDTATLEKLVAEHDLTVSLLPYKYHTDVARVCLRHGKSLITTSYVSDDMKALDAEANSKGVLLLNEMGLDPGIDHMSAMRIIDHIHNKGGRVQKFYSLCGALPAPEAATNPMRYKFTWSPKGVILASRNSALYLKNGKRISIGSEDIFKDRFSYNFETVGPLEVYPNRDSISYIDIYGIGETETMYRGTFRFKGWCETLDAIKSLGMLTDTAENYSGMSYADFLAKLSGCGKNNLRADIASQLGISEQSAVIESLGFLGFFSDEKLPYSESTPFEVTSDTMIRTMMLAEDERDMTVLQHLFLAAYPDGSKEVIKSSMLDFGSPSSNTSVARTVALPAAIAVKMILEKKIRINGVHRPVIPQIYNPVLDELKTLGIEMNEVYGLPASEMI